MAIDNRLKNLKMIEAGINKHFFLICSAVTMVTMLMVVIEFFTRGVFPPTRINMFYLAVLIIYSLHKELVRWLGNRKVERQGEYFVYGWIGLTTTLYLVNFLSKDYFSRSVLGGPLDTLNDVSWLTLEVLGVFILTRCLKILKTGFNRH